MIVLRAVLILSVLCLFAYAGVPGKIDLDKAGGFAGAGCKCRRDITCPAICGGVHKFVFCDDNTKGTSTTCTNDTTTPCGVAKHPAENIDCGTYFGGSGNFCP